MNPARLPCRLLVVEDVPDIQLLLARVLQEEGAEVVVAQNGRDALEQVRIADESDRPFRCILMDMKMPVLSGCETARCLRQAGYSGGIIAVTGWVTAGHREECLAAGCNDYLPKPFRTDHLLDMVAKWCRLGAGEDRNGAADGRAGEGEPGEDQPEE
jgi:CheY-like chemotaxis protein